MASLLPVHGLPLVQPGDNLPSLIVNAMQRAGIRFEPNDVLVIAQKIVSKAEGRLVDLGGVEPTPEARALALQSDKDPRLVELILRESREVLRVRPGVLIVEDLRGWVCANAGIDRSNIEQIAGKELVLLLPQDPDASCSSIAIELEHLTGARVPVVMNDSHGRAWREGTAGIAIGVAGIQSVWDRRGDHDLTGYTLQNTVIGLADELAAAASLVMGQADEGLPAVIVRGLTLPSGNGTSRDLQRPRERDLFR